MKNDVAARSSDNGAATGGDNQSSNLSSQIWSSMIADSQASQPSSKGASDLRSANNASETRTSNTDSGPQPSNTDTGPRPGPEPRPSESNTNSERRANMAFGIPSDSRSPRPNDIIYGTRISSPDQGSEDRTAKGSADRTATGSAERTPPNTASESATRREPSEHDKPIHVGGDIRPDSMVDNQTLMERFSQRATNIHMAHLESPVVRMLSPEFHQQSQQMINNADNLPFDRIRMERATTERQQQGVQGDMSMAEQRMLESSQRDPELQSMIPRMLQNVDNPRFHGMHGRDMDRLRQIAPDLAEAMDRRRDLGRHAEQLQGQIDDANTLLEKPTSTRFEYATNLVDSGLPENRDRAVQVLTDLLNNNPDAARYRMPGSSGNRSMAELILRTNALDNKAFARAFHRAGGDPNTLMQQWREDRWSFMEPRRPR